MKNSKKIFLVPLVVFVFSFVLISVLGESYSASDKYYYVRRNMLSHHLIKNNKSNTASGTILVKTGKASSNEDGDSIVVYCAEQGSNNSSSSHTKKSLDAVSSSLVGDNAKEELNAIMPYTYPYITLTELKNLLKDEKLGIEASLYSSYNFENLDAQESMTAVQAVIWNSIKGTDRFVYGKTVERISSSQSSFAPFGRVNWQTCEGYNLGTGKHETILTSEEKAWYNKDACGETGEFYKQVYSVKTDGLSDERINTLITWYKTLATKVENDVKPLNFSLNSKKFEQEDGKLTLKATIDSGGSDYSITFYDYNGKILFENQNVVGNALGNEFTITNLPIDTAGVNAEITATTSSKSVYYYQGSGQDWIGVDIEPTLNTFSLNILNDGSGQVIVYKVANDNVNVDVTYDLDAPLESKCGEGCIAGAYFILYANDKQTIIREFISETNSVTIPKLPNGTYYLYEQDPPYGYTRYDFNGDNVDSNGFIRIDITNGNTASVVVNNDLNEIWLRKVDSETNEILDGARFRVEDALGSIYEEYISSTQEDKHQLVGLDSGYYYLIEETAPTNYVKTNKIFKFAVGKFDPKDIVVDIPESENVILLESVNDIVTIPNDPGPVISKSDLSTGACLAGAKLIIKDKTDKIVDEWISTCEKGKETHTITLDPGTYTLIEDQAPIGYATAESITFTVDSDGKVNKSLDMKDAPIEVCFLKTSKDVNDGLVGAELEIYKEDGTLLDKFTSDYAAKCFKGVPVGKYKIVETKAPEGYKLNEEAIEIVVKDTSEVQIFEIENELEVPKTSMDASRIIVIIASIFMTFGLILVGYYGYKKQN